MIGKLTGKIDKKSDENIILDISGVGYLVYMSSRSSSMLEEGQIISLYIETIVREDLIQLFGFINEDEKKCFNLLIQVSGVGTKVALAILSTITVEEFIYAVNSKQKDYFEKVSGIGTKLAERIILELKNKISKIDFYLDKSILSEKNYIVNSTNKSSLINDAVSALTNLGIGKNDSVNIIKKIINEKPNISIDDLIKEALKARGL